MIAWFWMICWFWFICVFISLDLFWRVFFYDCHIVLRYNQIFLYRHRSTDFFGYISQSYFHVLRRISKTLSVAFVFKSATICLSMFATFCLDNLTSYAVHVIIFLRWLSTATLFRICVCSSGFSRMLVILYFQGRVEFYFLHYSTLNFCLILVASFCKDNSFTSRWMISVGDWYNICSSSPQILHAFHHLQKD